MPRITNRVCLAGGRFRSIARKTRKVTSTRTQKGGAEPAVASKESSYYPEHKDDEGLGPVGVADKKVVKGAVRRTAKAVLKNRLLGVPIEAG